MIIRQSYYNTRLNNLLMTKTSHKYSE